MTSATVTGAEGEASVNISKALELSATVQQARKKSIVHYVTYLDLLPECFAT